MREVQVVARPPGELQAVLPGRRLELLSEEVSSGRLAEFAGHSIVNVSSTALGGGVSEMLRVLLPYARGMGVDTRWLIAEGDAEFFTITKRLHNRLHGVRGDDGPLGPAEAAHMRAIGAANAEQLRTAVVPGDVLLLHDPQTAPLAAACASWGVPVVWRCHVGSQSRNEHTEQAWEFLRPFLAGTADRFVTTRADYAPAWAPTDRLHVITPSIDPLSPKNRELDADVVLGALQNAGVVGGEVPGEPVTFRRSDGSPGRFLHHADVIRAGPLPEPEAPLVVQVSRWDVLKDMPGVMQGFVEHVLDGTDAHLVLAGPAVTSVADDPTAAAVLDDTWERWHALPHAARSRVQLVSLPMADPDENAALVNALQRHATVVAQKSVQEGFGLTVTEAMYKRRACVASATGGITDQITDGVDGRLVEADDLAGFGDAVSGLLTQHRRREQLGEQAHRTVVERFLPDTSLTRWAEVMIAAQGDRPG